MDCWLFVLHIRSVGHRIVWTMGRLVSCWMVGGIIGLWVCWMASELFGWLWVRYLVNGSIGYWVPSSVVWWDGASSCRSASLWSVGSLVGQAFGGCHSFIHSDSQRAVRLVDCLFVWLSLAHGQSVGQPIHRPSKSLGGG